MKTRLCLAFIGLVINLTVESQVTTTSTIFTTKKESPDSTEYVTLGSTMPYKVAPFNWGSLSTFMDPSIYKWWLNGNATGYNLLKADGVSPLTPLPPPNNVYYSDSSISIQWIKTGKYTIRVNEKSMPKPGITTCSKAADIQTLDIVVADRPTVAWDGPTLKGGCNMDNSTQYVPLLLKGSKEITVTYTMVFTPQNGTSTTLANQTVNFTISKNDTTGTGSIPITVPQGNYGKYEITITGITDKISSKCGISSQASDIPTTMYTLAVLPMLESTPIKFVKELP